MSLLKRIFGSGQRSPTEARASGEAAESRDGQAPAVRPDGEMTLDATAIAIAATARIAAGEVGRALAMLDAALLQAQRDPSLLFVRAKALVAWGRTREAKAAFIETEAAGGRQDDLPLQLGLAYLYSGEPGAAREWLTRAASARGDSGPVRCALATALARDQHRDEARRCLERAVADFSGDAQCRIALGNFLLEQGDPGAAEAQFRNAVEGAGDDPMPWVYLGVALDRQNRAPEALAALERAVDLERAEDRDADIFVNHAVCLHVVGRTREAIATCERNLAQRPSAHGYRTYASALLAAGRLNEAWQFYDFRWYAEPQLSSRRDFGLPVWAGQDLRGKTILLHVEQGLGDVLQYVRYAPLVKALGATVLLVTTKAMVNLARSVPGVDRVLGPGEESPPFDYYVPLLGLPKVFGTDIDSVPAHVPYVAPDGERRRAAQADVARVAGTRFKVGLAWSGSASNAYNLRRACSLAVLAPLWDVADVAWFSLQRSEEDAVTGAHDANAPLALLDLRNDLDGTAALVDSLDLVICVDSSIAHLAGALGKRTWLLLPEGAHWTWMEDREDSPWYPTLRLFRQRERGNWAEVVERLRTELQDAVGRAGAAHDPGPVAAAVRSPQRLPCVGPCAGTGRPPGFAAVTETRYGILQYLPDAGDEGIALPWYGEWLQGRLDLLARMLRSGSTVLQVGAGIGAHAVWLGKTLGRDGHLLLSESRPVERRILRQNLAANRVANASLLSVAVGSADAAAETVDSMRLERLDWLIVENEAGRWGTLQGAGDTLWRLRPKLILAAVDAEHADHLAASARTYGYRCWRHATALFNPANFNRRDADVFAGRETFAVLGIPEEIDVDVALPGCVEL